MGFDKRFPKKNCSFLKFANKKKKIENQARPSQNPEKNVQTVI